MSRVKNKCRTRLSTKITVIILAGVLFSVLTSYLVFGRNSSLHSSTIRLAAILFRHGEKNPTSFYPNDPHAQREWDGGPGALTMTGSLQAYKLGINLRQRYEALLPKSGIYSQQDLHVVSSYAERCIMSALSLLAGLLPPPKQKSLLPIPWQPVPVTSLPRLDDTLIAQKKPCAKYDAMLKEIYKNPPPDLVELNEVNDELYHDLTIHTGKVIQTVTDVEFLYNTLKAESDIGLALPSWTKGTYPERLLPIAARSYKLFTDNEIMKRIKGGAFLAEIKNNMNVKTSKAFQSNPKLFLYSGHDVTLVNVMNSMGILNQTSPLPDYASALVFELHEYPDLSGQYEVRMVYYTDSDMVDPKPIDIPDCPTPCDLSSFFASIAHLLFEDYDEICQNPKKNC